MREVRTSGASAARLQPRGVRSRSGVLQHPIGDGVQGFRSNGLLDATILGGRTGRTVLEEVVQAGQFGSLKILIASVLQGFLNFSEIFLRRDLKILFTVKGED